MCYIAHQFGGSVYVLKTPSGEPAGNTDRIMLMMMWAIHIAKTASRRKKSDATPTTDLEDSTSNSGSDVDNYGGVIIAGIGRPTYPVNAEVTQGALDYWTHVSKMTQKSRRLFSNGARTEKTNPIIDNANQIAKVGAVIGYGDPQGDESNRRKMSTALARWYRTEISSEHVLFTVGGAGALHAIFSAINETTPFGRIVTPFPHYSLYAQSGGNRLYPIDVMKAPGYRLTAEMVENAIKEGNGLGEKDGGKVTAFLLCDPNNPLGTAVAREELEKIADVLRRNPEIKIILDEAYAEMCYREGGHVSLLTIAPDLKERIILMRSATKALSAAGERMAITVAFDPAIMAKLLEQNISSCGHAPKSLQFAFAGAMEGLDELELGNLRTYYMPQQEIVVNRLRGMGANMPDPDYHVEGAFYVAGDFSDLLGTPLNEEANEQVFSGQRPLITNDEDIAYHLLFQHKMMLAPLSYFGISAKLGYLRITCSGGPEELNELMSRLEVALEGARIIRRERLTREILSILPNLEALNPKAYGDFSQELDELINTPRSSEGSNTSIDAQLKETNQQLQALLNGVKYCHYLTKIGEDKLQRGVTKFQSFWRDHTARQRVASEKEDAAWYALVKENFDLPEDRARFCSYPPERRLNFKFWRNYLSEAHPENTSTSTSSSSSTPSFSSSST